MDSEYLHFVSIVVDTLEKLEVYYAIGGSLASSIYGEIRSTYDVDIAIQLQMEHVSELVEAFRSRDWYVFPEGIEKAVLGGGEFQIIDGSSGVKADFFVTPPQPMPRQLSVFGRARLMPYGLGDKQAKVMSPEDVILYKLEWYLLGKSEKHLRDIRAILGRLPIDMAYLDRWLDEIQARETWDVFYQTWQGQQHDE